MRSPNSSSSFGPRWRGRPRRPGGSAWPPRPRSCPAGVCSSRRPSPVTTKAAARMQPSKPMASSTKAAPGTSRHPGPPRGRPRGRRRRPSSARRAGSRGQLRGQLVEPPLQPLRPSRRRRPSAARRRAARVLERRAHVAHARPCSGRHARLPQRASTRARAAVGGGRPPTVTTTRAAPAATAAAISSPVPRVEAAQASRSPRPRAPARSPAPSPRSRPPVRQQREARPRPGGRAGRPRSTRAPLAPERRRAARPSCPRRRRRPAAPPPRGPPTRSPSAIAARHLARRERALEAVRGDQRGQLTSCVAERALGLVAVDGEHDPLEPALVLARHADHDPGGLVEREAAHARPERHERERPAPSRSAAPSVERVARSMISADVGRPAPSSPRGSPSARACRRRSSPPPRPARSAPARRDSRWTTGPARARDRAGHAAAVGQLGVGGVGDRVDLEPGHVRLRSPRAPPSAISCRELSISAPLPFVVRVNAARGAAHDHRRFDP